ncbi:MAG TPA: argininosuccinate lyase, partial [Pseudomonas sp.]|nr:argininosuccinate lyase [Pseudomonas sp.]
MPQKKNPVVLEYLKGRSGHIAGLLMAATMTVKGTHFSHSGDANREGTRGFWEAAEETLRCLRLLDLVLRTAEPDAVRGLERSALDFSTATGLADLIVREGGLSFREAHHVVGAVVRQALDAGLPARAIDGAMVDQAAQAVIGRPLGLDAARVGESLDPTANVASRQSPGGPAAPALMRTLAAARARLTLERER